MRMPLKTLMSLAMATTVVAAPNAFAGHGRHDRGWHDRGWHGASHWRYRDHDRYRYHHRGHYDHFGRWVAGAVVAGALVSLVADATAPRTVYYSDAPVRRVVYREPTVVYERDPVVVERRVYESRVYEDAPPTRYIRDDGWDDDDGD